ncbi:MAG: glycosyltransferase family 39 protein [Phycisphaerales bacterium]
MHAPPSTFSALRSSILLTAIIALARILYLAFFCPYTLIEDEAQYWVWAQNLDLSYYTKGPGVAWAIYASTNVFGNAEWAVRLPAVIASAIGAISLAGLSFDITKSRRITFLTAIAFHLVPSFLSLALLMTIDGPLVACWAFAAWCAWRGFAMQRLPWLLGLGLALGIGTLFKYTMLLALPGLVTWLFAWRHEAFSKRGTIPTLLIAMLLFGACLLPIIIWNQHNHWPTIAHQLGHLGIAGGDVKPTQGSGKGWHYNPLWTLTFLGTQIGLIGPILVLAIRHATESIQRRNVLDITTWKGESLCLALSLPVLIFYFIISFITEPEGNWPIAGSVTLIPLAATRVAMALTSPDRKLWRRTRFLWSFAIILGFIIGFGMLRVDIFSHLPNLGKLVPVGRITGARNMGEHASRIVIELRKETSQEPFIITHHYGRASQLWYYTPDSHNNQPHTPVYCASSLMREGRTTPWDFWPTMNLHSQPVNAQLLGRPALAVGLSREDWLQHFERVEEIGALDGDHKRDKQGKPSRPAFRCYNFRGYQSGYPHAPRGENNQPTPTSPSSTNGGTK